MERVGGRKIMITEKDNVFYCDCGFSFERGRSGAHNCEAGLRKKLAESEAKFAALAAENAGIKAAIDATIRWQQSTDPENVESVRMLVDVKTPATEAILADVMAQGVEMFSAHKRERQQALRSRSMRMSEEAAGMAADAEDFATQLRKGVQS
ncbi:hypothetical protein [Enterobacter hormaechei]|uniref:hypothetical protein n=1 Tax=Enterobacter hormaechei TaxID=158836 RepID=UPI002DBF1657|nr:hypothetical protein [Enterobacter hormaechei]MEB7643680.1 hypothetical protein [Enterobacter hormaechei]